MGSRTGKPESKEGKGGGSLAGMIRGRTGTQGKVRTRLAAWGSELGLQVCSHVLDRPSQGRCAGASCLHRFEFRRGVSTGDAGWSQHPSRRWLKSWPWAGSLEHVCGRREE